MGELLAAGVLERLDVVELLGHGVAQDRQERLRRGAGRPLDGGDARRHRIRNFVTAYGGTVTGTTIAAPESLRQRLRPSVQTFAFMFMMREAAARGYLGDHAPPTPGPGEPQPPERLATGVDMATHLYVDWLQTALAAEGP